MRKFASLLLVCFSVSVCAQSIDIPPRQCVWHAGDNPAWAAPSLDEAEWQPMSSNSADHLPPHVDGKELTLDGALPLGALLDISFPTLRFRLQPGQSMLFLSDGVVEAQSPTGELFGFERTRSISTQPAEQIAAAAQAHGQEDGITVLTLTFAPAEVLHA
jgi:hypothetical protein